LERSDNLGIHAKKNIETLKGFRSRRTLSGLNIGSMSDPGFRYAQTLG